MPETRVKARRYRIFQLSAHDCMTVEERELFEKYRLCNDKVKKKEYRRDFDNKVRAFSDTRNIPNSRLYKRNKDGSLSSEYREDIQNPMFEGEMARIANDFLAAYPLIKEIVYFECTIREILNQIIQNGVMIEGEKYIFYSATTNQMKKEMVILLKESFFKDNEKRIMCGLSRASINKGNERVKGSNRGKYLAYTSLPMSASVEVSSINTDEEQYEINIDDCIVVNDFEGKVHGKVNFLDVNTLITKIKEMDVDIPFMDGAGIYLPNAGILPRTGQIRGGYFKGCLFPFDFVKFIHSRKDSSSTIVDVYGDEVDIIKKEIKVIFTASQFKMWKYYQNWETFKKVFKECGCRIVLNNLAHNPSKNAEVRLTYQFLQTIRKDKFTEEAIQNLCKKTVDLLIGAKTDIDKTLKLFGITDDESKSLKPIQAALKLYPKLINDKAVEQMIKETINSKRKDAMGGKIIVDGFYAYICPDLYAFCENLFCGIKEPEGLIPANTVYNAYYNDLDVEEVDCLRSPHLADSEHCVRKLIKSKECKEWFNGYDTVISNHDLITKHLMCDCDGDEMLITSSQELISLVDRDNPALYYDMQKAETEQITDEVLYNCLISSFDNSIIGNISNALTKLYSVNGELDYEMIRILTAYNNYTIDYPKTQKAMNLKQFTEKYEALTDNKSNPLPKYFIYAKNKSRVSVKKEFTDCNVDRICQYIKEKVPKLKYSIFSHEKDDVINPEILKDSYIKVNRASEEYKKLILILDELHYNASQSQIRTKKVKNKLTENQSIDESELKVDLHYFLCRQAILNVFAGAEHKAATYLVDAEYYQPEFRGNNKKLIWNCFGDIIVKNISINLGLKKKINVRRSQYITKNSRLYQEIVKAVDGTKIEEKESRITEITDKEYEWIESQSYRKNSQSDRLLLFILVYLQKRYANKEGKFKIHTKIKQNGITPNTIDKWIGSDICKRGLVRLEKKKLITREDVVNQYGSYILIQVNLPYFTDEKIICKINGGNPLIPFFEYTGEHTIKECVICGNKFVAYGNAKTCGGLKCRKKLEKQTKDKCNKNVL